MVEQMEKWRRIDERAGACHVGDGNMRETQGGQRWLFDVKIEPDSGGERRMDERRAKYSIVERVKEKERRTGEREKR